MPLPPNTIRLRALMAEHGLSCADVASLLKRSTQTVTEWRCANSRVISQNNLELLELKLRLRSVANAS